MQAKTTLLFTISLVLWSGCGDYSNQILEEDLAFLYAVPEKSTLEIRISENQQREGISIGEGLARRSDALLGDLATWYLFTLVISQGVNRHVFGFLGLVDLVTEYPPTAREKDMRYWGPWPSAETPHTDWRFIMQRDRENKVYGFSLQANSAANRHTSVYPEGWENCLLGKVAPANKSLRRGVGQLSVDLGICGQYESTGERGIASIGYDTSSDTDHPGGKTHLTIQFFDFVTRTMLEKKLDHQPLNALYDYKENGDFSGTFRFEAWTDLHEGKEPSLDAEELVELYTQWDTTKAGRADIRISGGDLGPIVIQVAECWDSDKKRVYYHDSHEPAPTEGDPEDCALDPEDHD